jgi:hypothetical protein
MTLAGYETTNLQDTIRKMLQRLMTRELATSFSFTGLGCNRQAVKNKFFGHPAYIAMNSTYTF